jgi:ubiquinone biosynthesis protein COQ9
MIPNLSERMLKRLKKAWPSMDVEARTQALSELVLPCLTDSNLSTPRLEELIWHRLLFADHPVDVVSQLHTAMVAWPKEVDAAKVHASKLADYFIVHGAFEPSRASTD